MRLRSRVNRRSLTAVGLRAHGVRARGAKFGVHLFFRRRDGVGGESWCRHAQGVAHELGISAASSEPLKSFATDGSSLVRSSATMAGSRCPASGSTEGLASDVEHEHA